MNPTSKAEPLRPVISAEQILQRLREMGRQISDHYQGETIHALAVLENSFIFMADLVRAPEVPVACAFVKPNYRKQPAGGPSGSSKSSSATNSTFAARRSCSWKALCTLAYAASF